GFAFSLRHTSKPSMSGIITSSRMRSGLSALLAIAKACSPLVAIFTLNESLSTPETTAMLVGVSSTISTSLRSGLDIICPQVFQLKTRCDARKLFYGASKLRSPARALIPGKPRQSGRGHRNLNRKLDSGAITLLGAAILKIIRETLDKV